MTVNAAWDEPGEEVSRASRPGLAEVLLAQGLDRFQWGWRFVPDERPVYNPLERPELPAEAFGQAAAASRLASLGRAVAAGGVALGAAMVGLALGTSMGLGAPFMAPAFVLGGVAVAGGGLGSEYWRRRARSAAARESRVLDRHDARLRESGMATRPRGDTWRPVQAPVNVQRTDVLCGTWDGWGALIATVGGLMMGRRRSVVVMDLTNHGVAEDLILLVTSRGESVPCGRFPTDLSLVDLFVDVEPEGVGRVIADAFAVLPGRAGTAETRRFDEEVVAAVTGRIARPWTFRHLAAGMRVLRRLGESRDRDGTGGIFTDAEYTALRRISREFTESEQDRAELAFLDLTFAMLARNEDLGRAEAAALADDGTGGPERGEVTTAGARDRRSESGLWRPGLTVLAAPVYNNDQGASARILLYRFMEDLRHGEAHTTDDLIIVAGVDRLGRDVLDEFSVHAHRAGVRTIFLHQRLPQADEAQRMLNSDGSVTLLMRTTNALEAEAATKLVGSRYRFVLSQETTNTSESLGRSREQTVSTGNSDSEDSSRGWNIQVGLRQGARLPVFTRASNRSRGSARSRQWSLSRGQSRTTERGQSESHSRVFEPDLEPIDVESLPETAFLVLNRHLFPEPLLGDCDPGICLHPQLAPPPRRPLT